ncbi:MAG: hypothetical protein LBR80_17935 [Deltaproteobacteria bacterium]|nr:hypothetical protein [Deltaproteobacteria bacterium]
MADQINELFEGFPDADAFTQAEKVLLGRVFGVPESNDDATFAIKTLAKAIKLMAPEVQAAEGERGPGLTAPEVQAAGAEQAFGIKVSDGQTAVGRQAPGKFLTIEAVNQKVDELSVGFKELSIGFKNLKWSIGIATVFITAFLTIILNVMYNAQADRMTGISNTLETKMSTLETRMSGLETRMDKLETKVDELHSTVGDLRVDVGVLLSSLNGPRSSGYVPQWRQPMEDPANRGIPGQGAPAESVGKETGIE